jgi:hypothetical protein
MDSLSSEKPQELPYVMKLKAYEKKALDDSLFQNKNVNFE